MDLIHLLFKRKKRGESRKIWNAAHIEPIGHKKTPDGRIHREFRNSINQTSASRLGDFDIYCIHSFFAALRAEGDVIAFANVVDQTGDVDEDFLLGGAVGDKAEAFGFIEELYCSVVH